MDLITLKQLIKEDKLIKFYQCGAWRTLRAHVLKRDNNECQHCKAEGRVTTPHAPHPDTMTRSNKQKDRENKIKSLHVHHITEVKDYPELSLVESNLITLCQECHNKEHDRLKHYKNKRKRFTNKERW